MKGGRLIVVTGTAKLNISKLLSKLSVNSRKPWSNLQGVSSLVDNQDVQHDVILIDVHIGLSIYWVRETC